MRRAPSNGKQHISDASARMFQHASLALTAASYSYSYLYPYSYSYRYCSSHSY